MTDKRDAYSISSGGEVVRAKPSQPRRPFLLYFGCWDQAGHYLWDRNKRTIYDARAAGLPFDANYLDGSTFFLPHPERVGSGALTHVVRDDVAYTVLAWWGSPWDGRGKVNSAIISSGWDDADDIWWRFTRVYEELAKHLHQPRTTESRIGNSSDDATAK